MKKLMASLMHSSLNVLCDFSFHKVVKFRHRYVLTRSNRIRVRYAATGFAVCALAGIFAFSGTQQHEMNVALVEMSQDVRPLEITERQDIEEKSPLSVYASVLPENFIDLVRVAPAAGEEETGARKFEIKSGETIGGILQNAGLNSTESHKVVEALKKHVDMRKIQAGQVFDARFEKSAPAEDAEGSEAGLVLAEMSMDIDSIKSVNILKDGDAFKAEIKEKEVIKRTYAGSTEIQTSLYGSAARSGIPSPVIAKIIRMYSWSVDFQRDIRRDDKIEVLYDVYETEDGKHVRYGDIQYANLNLGGIDLQLYQYEDDNGSTSYYDKLGRSAKKTIMKTPVDGARMSSGFGMRKHPILGYGKMHKGVDFAAPIGTPVYAAGDGVLEEVGRKGAYGNYVRIRHTSSLKTAYAHLHKFAKGMSSGKRVKQGDLIAYVGSTGRSTGPHLHFEVLMNGEQVNPNRVDLSIGEDLKGKKLDRFKRLMKDLEQKYVQTAKGMKFAAHEDKGADKGSKSSS